MTGGEYLLGLILIITGLAISDMVVSLHAILLKRQLVKWDWLALMAAAYVFLMIVNSWGVSFKSWNFPDVNPPLWQFLELLGQIIPLYLAARASLPDEVPDEGVDLARHYASISRYLWAAVATTLILYLVGLAFGRGAIIPAIELNWGVVAQLALILPLIAFGNRKLHAICVPLVMLLFSIDHLTVPMFG
jgi:hypothetical protein